MKRAARAQPADGGSSAAAFRPRRRSPPARGRGGTAPAPPREASGPGSRPRDGPIVTSGGSRPCSPVNAAVVAKPERAGGRPTGEFRSNRPSTPGYDGPIVTRSLFAMFDADAGQISKSRGWAAISRWTSEGRERGSVPRVDLAGSNMPDSSEIADLASREQGFREPIPADASGRAGATRSKPGTAAERTRRHCPRLRGFAPR